MTQKSYKGAESVRKPNFLNSIPFADRCENPQKVHRGESSDFRRLRKNSQCVAWKSKTQCPSPYGSCVFPFHRLHGASFMFVYPRSGLLGPELVADVLAFRGLVVSSGCCLPNSKKKGPKHRSTYRPLKSPFSTHCEVLFK